VTALEEKCTQVECGDCHTVALTESGRVFLWGCYKDANGQLGFDAEGTDTQVRACVRALRGATRCGGGGWWWWWWLWWRWWWWWWWLW
jgi:hypothetical protein